MGKNKKLNLNAVDFLKDLINIPSLSGEEKEISRRLKIEFEELQYDKILEAGENVCGRIGTGNITVLYDAHTDVVEAGDGWRADPFKARVEGEYIIGRGACDDKGPLAAMVYGGALSKTEGITLYVVGSVREEVSEGNALKEFFEATKIKPDFIVIGEPSSLRIAKGNRGRLGIRIDVEGKAGHASRPDRGINAIYRASKIVYKIKKLNESLCGDSVVVTKIETPNKNINIIPEKCSIYCDYRSAEGRKENEIIKKFTSFIEPPDSVKGITPYYKPWQIEEKSILLKSAAECMKDVIGKTDIVVWDFCTNGSYTAGELGLPTIGFGPGRENQCHSAEEKIKISSLNKAVNFFAELPCYIKKNV